jgi:pimeloyl-ACP methyl ester carboxylesterase
MDPPPPPGRLLDIGGRCLHAQLSGATGPVVVLESGIAATSLNWRAVQNEIARFARVLSYDRAGLGWSDPAPDPLTLARLVRDLRALLRAAGLLPPYCLVGHSYGALIVRAYAGRHPDEVSGLVLVDPLGPAEWHPLTAERRRLLGRGVSLARRGEALARIGLVGWCLRSFLRGARWWPKLVGRAAGGEGMTVMRRLAGEIGKMPPEVWPLVVALWSTPKSFAGMAAHFEALPGNAEEMCGAPPLDGIPVIVLTSPTSPAPGSVSSNLRHIVAGDCGHWIHLDRPDLVVDAVRKLIV